MDAIAYAHADKQQQRIKTLIAQPDSVSGLVTMPSVVATGEVISIPTGRTVVHPNLQVDGILDVQGTLFIPSGGSVSTTEVDATVVKQNGNVVANDSTVVHKTGDETKTGTMTFMDNVGIGGDNVTGYKLDIFGPSASVPASVSNRLSLRDLGATSSLNFTTANEGGNLVERVYSSTGLVLGTGATEKLRIDTSGNVLVTGSGGLGYGTGSGGTVTQVGSMYDPVALNKPSGKIHTFSQGIPAGASIVFNLYNTQILSIDTIVSTLAGDFSTKYELNTYIQSDGFVVFSIKNKTGGTLTESRTISFTTIKGAIA